jgi:hypothetical protein
MSPSDINANAFCARVGRRGIADSLNGFCKTSKLPQNLFTPAAPSAKHLVTLPEFGFEAMMSHPHAGRTQNAEQTRWCMTEIIFYVNHSQKGNFSGLFPFDLDVSNETPDTVKKKLGDDCTHFSYEQLANKQYNQSYFLEDASVVEITWLVQNKQLQGIAQLWVVRLGNDAEFNPIT